MYVPNVDIFYEKYEKKKTLAELINQEPPSQPELELFEGDINSVVSEICVAEEVREKTPPVDVELALICRKTSARGFLDVNSVLAVFDRGKQKTACVAELPKNAKKTAFNLLNSSGRRRKGFVKLPATVSDTPWVYLSDNGRFCIREFEVSVMGEILKEVVFREWWEIHDNGDKASLRGLELGAKFSLQNREKIKKDLRLLLD